MDEKRQSRFMTRFGLRRRANNQCPDPEDIDNPNPLWKEVEDCKQENADLRRLIKEQKKYFEHLIKQKGSVVKSAVEDKKMKGLTERLTKVEKQLAKVSNANDGFDTVIQELLMEIQAGKKVEMESEKVAKEKSEDSLCKKSEMDRVQVALDSMNARITEITEVVAALKADLEGNRCEKSVVVSLRSQVNDLATQQGEINLKFQELRNEMDKVVEEEEERFECRYCPGSTFTEADKITHRKDPEHIRRKEIYRSANKKKQQNPGHKNKDPTSLSQEGKERRTSPPNSVILLESPRIQVVTLESDEDDEAENVANVNSVSSDSDSHSHRKSNCTKNSTNWKRQRQNGILNKTKRRDRLTLTDNRTQANIELDWKITERVRQDRDQRKASKRINLNEEEEVLPWEGRFSYPANETVGNPKKRKVYT